MIQSIHCGPEQVWFIVQDCYGQNKIYVTGDNAKFLLGLDPMDSVQSPFDNDIQHLFENGNNDNNIDNHENIEGKPFMRLVTYFVRDSDRLNDPIVKVCAGYSSAFWLTRRGIAFVTGDNRQGACGMGALVDYCKTPCHFELPNHELVKDVSCGSNHALILAMNGTVWSTGQNDYGQLGVPNRASVFSPQLIKLDEPVRSVSAGYNHSMVLSESGNLWAFGANNLGQIGSGSSHSSNFIPTKIDLEIPTRFAGVWTGNNHTVMLTVDGDLYSVGCNTDGRLGLGDLIDRSRPTKINTPQTPVQNVVCGSWHTYYILNGDIYSSGANSDGQSGIEHCQHVQNVTQVNLPDWFLNEKASANKKLSIACGEAFTIVYLHSESSTITHHFARLYSMYMKQSGTYGFKDLVIISSQSNANI
jgi:alpha-tubulin suppressor-like RCC1 family protein